MSGSRFRTVVVAHGGLARALVDAAQLIAGSASDVRSVDLSADETPESFGERLRLELPGEGADALVLTDLHGGTPHNVAMTLQREARPHVISGASLAVVLEAITSTEPLSDALVERLIASGRGALSGSRGGMVERPAPQPTAAD